MIPIEPIPLHLIDDNEEMEDCVFCQFETLHWHIESNRPVCPLCSVANDVYDIQNAPFNY